MKHYVYQHIRLDKNEPFYIGIGTMYRGCICKTRAFEKKTRNKIWKFITSKTDYKVEIILESDSYEEVKLKEKELIKLYGRIDNKTGILSNLTDGGDGKWGTKNEKVAERNRLSKGENHWNTGRKRIDMINRRGENHPMYNKKGKLNSKSRKFMNTLNGEIYYGVKEAANAIGVPEGRLNNYVYKGTKNKTILKWEK